MLEGHNTTPEFIETGVCIFASPVIYTVEVPDVDLTEETVFSADDLAGYANTETIPFFQAVDWKNDGRKSLYQSRIETLPEGQINISKLDQLNLAQVLEVSYLNADTSEKIVDLTADFSMDLRTVGLFMAAIGAAAVALAFAVLSAGVAVVIASVSAAVGLVGLGLFAAGAVMSASKNAPRSEVPDTTSAMA